MQFRRLAKALLIYLFPQQCLAIIKQDTHSWEMKDSRVLNQLVLLKNIKRFPITLENESIISFNNNAKVYIGKFRLFVCQITLVRFDEVAYINEFKDCRSILNWSFRSCIIFCQSTHNHYLSLPCKCQFFALYFYINLPSQADIKNLYHLFSVSWKLSGLNSVQFCLLFWPTSYRVGASSKL